MVKSLCEHEIPQGFLIAPSVPSGAFWFLLVQLLDFLPYTQDMNHNCIGRKRLLGEVDQELIIDLVELGWLRPKSARFFKRNPDRLADYLRWIFRQPGVDSATVAAYLQAWPWVPVETP